MTDLVDSVLIVALWLGATVFGAVVAVTTPPPAHDGLIDLLSSGWLATIIAIVGIIVAAVTYLLSRQRTVLVYAYTGERLLGLKDGSLPQDITVMYRGEDIPRLTRSIVVIWNAGEKTIISEDLVRSDPLRLVLKDGKVLSATVLRVSRGVTALSCSGDASRPTEVDINFAFLDSKDGAVIEVLHTSEERNMEMRGTIRGLPKGLRNLGTVELRRTQVRFPGILGRFSYSTITGMTGIVLGIVMLGGASAIKSFPRAFVSPATNPLGDAHTAQVTMLAGGALYFTIGAIMFFLSRRRYPKSLRTDEIQ